MLVRSGDTDDGRIGSRVVADRHGLVAGGTHDDVTQADGALDGGVERVARARQDVRPGHAEVDDAGAVVGCPVDSGRDALRRAHAVLVQDADGHHQGVGRGPRDPRPVVGHGRGEPRNMGAVGLLRWDDGSTRRDRCVGHEVEPGHDLGLEVGMRRVDHGVDDRDHDAVSPGRGPGLGGVHLLQPPLGRQQGVVGSRRAGHG